MIATAGLGVTGVLETTEQGDIEYISTEQFKDGSSVIIPSDNYQYAIESPTDANAFYNAVVRANNGGPLINRGISETEGIMRFHYHPITYYFYAIMSIFGYVGFKFLLLMSSLLAVMAGTAFLILAERKHVDIDVSRNTILVLAVASIGVGPVLSNLKTGQTSPFLYFFVSLFWWGYRHTRLRISGVMLAIATFFKPYAIAPIALGFNQKDIHVLIWTSFTYLVGTIFAIAVFGTREMNRYFTIIMTELLEESAQSASQITSASNLSLLSWIGEVSLYLRILLFIPLASLGVKYLIDGSSKYSLPLFSATLLSIFILLSDTTTIDLPLLLPIIILIGLHTYCEANNFWIIGVIFMLFHIHPLVLEVLVGNGSKYIPLFASNQHILQTFIPILQPGIYSIFGLYYITFASTTVYSTVDN
jgi:hypothetical protein